MPLRSGVSTWSSLLPLLCGLALGCGDDEARFLSLEELCPELASDLCTARNGGCCAAVDPMRCESEEEQLCRARLSTFTAEPAPVHFDSVAAATQRDAVRAMLDACGPQPALASFFLGGFPLGAACVRPTQCASGACAGEPLVCVPAAPVALCAPVAAPP